VACDDPPGPAQPPAGAASAEPPAAPAAPARPPATVASATAAEARRVAVEKIATGLHNPAAARFRGVQVYQQADAGVLAVCGQVNPDGRNDQAFIPFVSVVTTTPGTDGGTAEFDIEQFVATSTPEATRVYIEMSSRCGENGGPRQVGNRKAVTPLPPLPGDLPTPLQPALLQSGPPPGTGHGPAGQFALTPVSTPGGSVGPAASALTGQSVVMRQAGNIRTAPVGGSQLVRVAPRGAVLRVLAQAPGGWLQVGETEAEGWVHSSLVENR
jgi:hypothetical protein